MGREIRRVPPNWEHPRWDDEYTKTNRPDRYMKYRSCYDKDYDSAAKEWLAELKKFEPDEYTTYYWEDQPPPDPETYRPAFTEDPTWYQVYETVSEGTPVTPPFATQEELIDYLVEYGDFWCQRSLNEQPPSREAASAFVKSGWAPSMVVTRHANGVEIKSGVDSCVEMNSE